MKIFVTGATGYIVGRLVPKLLDCGHNPWFLLRDRTRSEGRKWIDCVEVFEGDLKKPASLAGLCDGVEAAYYLVHSMVAERDFVETEHRCTGSIQGALESGRRGLWTLLEDKVWIGRSRSA